MNPLESSMVRELCAAVRVKDSVAAARAMVSTRNDSSIAISRVVQKERDRAEGSAFYPSVNLTIRDLENVCTISRSCNLHGQRIGTLVVFAYIDLCEFSDANSSWPA